MCRNSRTAPNDITRSLALCGRLDRQRQQHQRRRQWQHSAPIRQFISLVVLQCCRLPSRVPANCAHALSHFYHFTSSQLHLSATMGFISDVTSQDPSLALMKRVAAATVTGCGGGIWAAVCACVDDDGGGSSALTIFDSRTLRIIANAPLTPPPHSSAPLPSSLPSSSSSASAANTASSASSAAYHAREWYDAISLRCRHATSLIALSLLSGSVYVVWWQRVPRALH